MIEISSISRLQLQADETLVVKVPGIISYEGSQRLRALVASTLPGHNKAQFLILDGGVDLQVISPRLDLVAKVKAAMATYEQALRDRQHGGVAAGQAIEQIQQALADAGEQA